MKIEQASPQRDGTQQNNKLKNSPAKRVAKPAAGTTAPSQGVTGYSNRNKKNAWGQGGKSGGKPATKTQQGGGESYDWLKVLGGRDPAGQGLICIALLTAEFCAYDFSTSKH